MPLVSDLQRMKEVYAERKRRVYYENRYSSFYLPCLYENQQRQRNIINVLRNNGFEHFSNRTILEVGCGSGGVLKEYLGYGVQPGSLFGIDILPHRLSEARRKLPHSPLSVADGQSLPCASRSFDLVLQFTAFSSVLDSDVRMNMAKEMLRVVKQNGMILWYDFWINPTNKQTRGIRPAEICELFSNSKYEFHRITLAPPIAKKVVPISWMFALFLESLKIFNSHYLVTIRPV
jgi:ubiquinone/menaquinone biosynthesis C-methylase UbiE